MSAHEKKKKKKKKNYQVYEEKVYCIFYSGIIKFMRRECIVYFVVVLSSL